MRQISIFNTFIFSIFLSISINAEEIIFPYPTINNSGKIIEKNYKEYTLKLYSDYNVSADDLARHVAVMVKIDKTDYVLFQIQESYIGHNIILSLYNKENKLLSNSAVQKILGNTIVTLILDSDNDGIPNDKEEILGLNPNDNDSDGDGILDLIEVGDINNPRDSDGDGTIDALDLDSDNDGVSDEEERVAGTDPTDKNDYPSTGLTQQEQVLFMILMNRSNQLNQVSSSNETLKINIPAILMIEVMQKKE